jgi:hypothetical protein
VIEKPYPETYRFVLIVFPPGKIGKFVSGITWKDWDKICAKRNGEEDVEEKVFRRVASVGNSFFSLNFLFQATNTKILSCKKNLIFL